MAINNRDLDKYVARLPRLYYDFYEIQKQVENHGYVNSVQFEVDNYSELLLITGQSLYDFAQVLNSQGTQWLPGGFGGTYYPAGRYYWEGTSWVNDKEGIYIGIENLTTGLANHTHVKADITDFVEADYTKITDAEIAALGYVKTDNDTQRTDTEINALIDANTNGYITGYTVTESDVTAHEDALSIDSSQVSNLPTGFSGNYNDLTNKPTIPTVPTNVSSFTNDSNYITDYTVTEGDVTAHQAALSITESQISDLSHFSGDYTDLTNKPTIPTNNNELSNGAGYIDDYTVTEGDVTAHQSALSITESQISDLNHFSGNYNDLTNKPTVITTAQANAIAANTLKVSYTDASDVSANTTARHSHTNKVTLDKFGEDGSGNPTYNGTAIDTTIAQRDVYDGLDSSDNTISLSAKQGKTLKDVQDTQGIAIGLNTAKISFDSTSSTKLSGIETGAEVNVQSDWNATSGDAFILNKPTIPTAFSGDYNDLTNQPTIPTVPTTVSSFTNDANYITGYTVTESDVTAHEDALSIDASQVSNLPAGFSGSYTDLTNKPTIPTNNSQLTNGANYITGYTVTSGDVTAHEGDITITESQISDLSHFSGDYADLTNKPTIPTVPTTISSFTNDSGYITDYTVTESDVTAHESALTITVSQISDYTGGGGGGGFSGDYNDLTNKPTIPTVPTNVSDFTNDSGYITETELVTDTSPQLGGNLDGNGFNISLDSGNSFSIGSFLISTAPAIAGGNVSAITSQGNMTWGVSEANHDIIFQTLNSGGTLSNAVVANGGGGVDVSYDGTVALSTTADGVTITDELKANTIVKDGATNFDVLLGDGSTTPLLPLAKAGALNLQQSLLAQNAQPALNILAVAATTSGKVQGSSLSNGNVVEVYASGDDYNSATVLYREFLQAGEPICFTGLSAGAIVTSTGGFYGFSEQVNGSNESPMPLMSLGLAVTDTFFYAFRNSEDPLGGNTGNRGEVTVVCGPLAAEVSLFRNGNIVNNQENILLEPFELLILETNANAEYRLVATSPVMAAIQARMGSGNERFYDTRLIMPTTNDGITWPRSGQVSAPYNNTEVDYYVRDGADGNFTLSPGSPVDFDSETGATDADYEPNGATRVIVKGLVSAYSGADSSGLEATPMLPTSAMSQIVAQPFFISDNGDGGNSGIAIASPYQGVAKVYEWNSTNGVADLAYTVNLRRGTNGAGIVLSDPEDQLYPCSGIIANEPNLAQAGEVSYVELVGDLGAGYIVSDVPITVVAQNGNVSHTPTVRSQNGTTTSCVVSDDDETLLLGFTPPLLKMELVADEDGFLRKRSVDSFRGDASYDTV